MLKYRKRKVAYEKLRNGGIMMNKKVEERKLKKCRHMVKRVCVLGMAAMMTASLAGCGLKTNAGANAKEKGTRCNVKYMSGNETVKYEEDNSWLKIGAKIKAVPKKVPEIKATPVKFNEKILVKELLQEGMRTEMYQKGEPQYSGKNGDILNIDSSVRFYMLSNFYDNLFNCFHLSSRDPEYNADKYSQTTDFEFMSRQEALELVIDKLKKCGANIENYNAAFYCLDYKTLKKEECVYDKNGDVAPKSQWKDKWTEDDNCYYIAIRPLLNDIPEYHPQTGFDIRYEDYCSPIQAIVSKDGIRYMDVDGIMEYENTGENVKVLSPQQVLDNMREKKFIVDRWEEFGKKSKYTLHTMNLCYFSDMSYGKVETTMPVYQCYIKEKFWNGMNWDTTVLQFIVDAKTGEKIDVYKKTNDFINGVHD